MDEREVINVLLGQLLGPRLGHLPATWPSRLYDEVERLARAASQDRAVFLKRLIGCAEPAAIDALIDASTIGHTSFFRHPEQFEHLRKELPRLASRHRTAVRIWCAACSTGEEAYSIALTAERAGILVDILGTDVSPLAIRSARAGVYSDSRTGRLPVDAGAKEWAAPASLRTMVRFEVASIVGPEPACGSGPFDLIFCRNLLIYFERDAVPQILEGLAENLHPSGALVLSPADAVLPLPAVLRRGGMVGWLHPATEPAAPVSSRALSMRVPSMRVRAAVAGNPAPTVDEMPIERAARLFGSGQGEEAEVILAELLNRDPDDIAGWFLLGEALLQRGERSQARVAFTRASRCSPKEAGGVDGEALQKAATRRALALDG